MCRWMAWLGQPVLIEELLFKTQHGIVDQSLHVRLGAEPTNGDGFGLGWYGAGAGPAVYRSVSPAWSDANLRELAAHVASPPHPDNPRFARLTPDDRLIVSEPFSDLPGVWREIPQSTAVTAREGGALESQPFRPTASAAPGTQSTPSLPAAAS